MMLRRWLNRGVDMDEKYPEFETWYEERHRIKWELKICLGGEPRYSHQCGGVACQHRDIGSPRTFGYVHKENGYSYLFNPDWWYHSTHREDDGGAFLVPGYIWKTPHSSGWEEYRKEEEGLLTHPDKIYVKEIAHRIESALEEINPDMYRDFVSTSGFIEAYFPCKCQVFSVEESSWKDISAIVIWENCD